MTDKINLWSLSEEALADFLQQHGEKPFRARQIRKWLLQRGVTRFDEMTDLSKKTRELLKNHLYIRTAGLSHIQESRDGTVKLGLTLWDGKLIESVLIPGKDRATACVSSQVGCQLGCTFCATGKMGFTRNLEAEEIFDQVIFVRQLAEGRGLPLSNIVLMGMGEPLLNYDNVLQAIRVITAEESLGMSPSRITLSTAGIPEGIRRLADDRVRFNLAVSLHSAIDEVRNRLMPVNKAWPLAKLADAIALFAEKTGNRPTLEYLLLGGINDSLSDAKALADYCRRFPVKINIIEYNAVKGSAFKPAPDESRNRFVEFLESRNMVVNVRRSKGKDIDAACGQLISKNN